jgi:hypothetical protein
MTLAEIHRMIRAAIRAARKEGAPEVEIKIGDEAIVSRWFRDSDVVHYKTISSATVPASLR